MVKPGCYSPLHKDRGMHPSTHGSAGGAGPALGHSAGQGAARRGSGGRERCELHDRGAAWRGANIWGRHGKKLWEKTMGKHEGNMWILSISCDSLGFAGELGECFRPIGWMKLGETPSCQGPGSWSFDMVEVRGFGLSPSQESSVVCLMIRARPLGPDKFWRTLLLFTLIYMINHYYHPIMIINY